MEIPELTPQRQKMLMGAAAAGLLLVLGFSFAPNLDVAENRNDEVDEVLAIIDQDREPRTVREDATEPRPLRRSRFADKSDDSSSKKIERPRELPLAVKDAEKPVEAEATQVVPPAYQQRLELLAQEEAALVRHHQRPGEGTSAEPMPTVTVASVEAVESESNDVEHALAQARRPNRFRRVELIEGTASRTAAPSVPPRGAWLSGSIESD
jgi:hypothetical protein